MQQECFDQLRLELEKFADPGASGVKFTRSGASLKFELVRAGNTLVLESGDFYTQPIAVVSDGARARFSAYAEMLASPMFCDLAGWARSQAGVLRTRREADTPVIQPFARLEPGGKNVDGLHEIRQELTKLQSVPNGVGVLLIDGPAGVGKTHLIETLSLDAATGYGAEARLILHVRSRGKVLSNIDDLMAFSLQSLRVNVTFDQVPILVRHGLVTLAIDGFDELGDPEGYGHAWGQLNSLIDSVKGHGCVILAGRETFIGRERLLRSVKALASDSVVAELTLDEVPPERAEEWLRETGMDDSSISSLKQSGLIHRGSFALRPFFLWYLRKVISDDSEWLESYSRLSDVLPLVVNAMIDREVRRFGEDIAAKLTSDGVKRFIVKFLSETAREMAGDETEAIAETMLSWIVELSLPTDADRDMVSLLKARAGAMAFLALDDRSGYRRFSHSQFFNYFLSRSVLDSLGEQDIPKWLRRGSVGADFLVAFVPFLRVEAISDPSLVAAFRRYTVERSAVALDEGNQLLRNFTALAFSTLTLSKESEPVVVNGREVQHAYAGVGSFHGSVSIDYIHTLDLRSCDAASLDFSSTNVGTLLADATTRVRNFKSSVQAVRFQREDGTSEDTFDPPSISSLLLKLTPRDDLLQVSVSPALLLADKLARSRRYWFKPKGDDLFGDIEEAEGWSELKSALEAEDMIRVDRSKQASGNRAEWFHIKNARGILLRDRDDPSVRSFLNRVGWNTDSG